MSLRLGMSGTTVGQMEIPRDIYPDSTIPLAWDPYRFIARTCNNNNTNIFFSRLMLQPTVFMSGMQTATLFYNESCFKRSGAAPKWLQKTLFGEGGIQTLDGEEHTKLKQMFMSLTSSERAIEATRIVRDVMDRRIDQWAKRSNVVLYNEFHEILTEAAFAWTGIPLRIDEAGERAKELISLFDQAANFGHFKARRARKAAEQRVASFIEGVRGRRTRIDENSPAYIVAHYRDLHGTLLSTRQASVEILNLLRPIVAVSVYTTFCALALHQYPECREKIESEAGYVSLFVQEVRRFFPFFPSVIAKVRNDFEWSGYRFRKGWNAVLDLYGINHDPKIWGDPESFRPERFRDKKVCPFNFVPQGGGDPYKGHRCPGESITTEIMKTATKFLAAELAYDVPPQDLRITYRRLPALPRSRLVISNVKKIRSVVATPADGTKSLNSKECTRVIANV